MKIGEADVLCLSSRSTHKWWMFLVSSQDLRHVYRVFDICLRTCVCRYTVITYKIIFPYRIRTVFPLCLARTLFSASVRLYVCEWNSLWAYNGLILLSETADNKSQRFHILSVQSTVYSFVEKVSVPAHDSWRFTFDWLHVFLWNNYS